MNLEQRLARLEQREAMLVETHEPLVIYLRWLDVDTDDTASGEPECDGWTVTITWP
jgi:hypothetical protein